MDRLACVDVPALPLQLLLARHPDWKQHPAVVVDRDQPQGKILCTNEHARRRRIRPMPPSCPQPSIRRTTGRRACVATAHNDWQQPNTPDWR